MVQDLSTWKVETRSETVRNTAVDATTLTDGKDNRQPGRLHTT